MVRHGARPVGVTPEPPATLHVTCTPLASGTVLHRVHQSQYLADQFNPGRQGNARFSPIQDDSARAIVLFGDRIPSGALRPGADSRSLLEDVDAYDAVLDLAERIGVHVVMGKR